MSDDLKDILLDGETVLWRGASDFSRAQRKPESHKTRQLHRLGWLAGLATLAVGSYSFGHFLNLTGFVGTLVAVLTVFLIIGTLFVFSRLFAKDIIVREKLDIYLVTDRRVMALDKDRKQIRSMNAGHGSLVSLYKNGDLHDLTIGLPVDDHESNIFFTAIEDGPAVHKLVLQTLVHARDLTE